MRSVLCGGVVGGWLRVPERAV